MHELYELKDKLCKELEEYGSRQLDVGSLDVVDKLSHTIKNLDKIIENYEEEEGYSGRYDDGMNISYRGDGNSSYRGRSYARNRDSMGRYSRRRYSRTGNYSMAKEDTVMELRELMNDAPDERTRQEIHNLVEKLERM